MIPNTDARVQCDQVQAMALPSTYECRNVARKRIRDPLAMIFDDVYLLDLLPGKVAIFQCLITQPQRAADNSGFEAEGYQLVAVAIRVCNEPIGTGIDANKPTHL